VLNRVFLWRYFIIPLFLFTFGFSLFFPATISAESPAPPEVPIRLVIPAIDLDSPVTPVGRKLVVIDGKTYRQWETADNQVGWHNLSAKLGEVGNTVLAGHSDIYAKVFQNLKDVKVGDTVIAYDAGQPYYYVVTDTVLVKEKDVSIEQRLANARWIDDTDDERITMVTCAQPGATHRLIVVARPLVLVQQTD